MSASRRVFFKSMAALSVAAPLSATAAPVVTGAQDRAYWVGVMDRIARPVLSHLAAIPCVRPCRSSKNPGPDAKNTAISKPSGG
ncbi:hypothetical protein [Asticcacaulis sp. YBE204]|uniref:hypothetical protein n=1 Tax=Asticcacaulis sp. YBE204 TaxID=1282363 RepID=UPI0003C3CB88|nr:hypothetical protein [Asticcacaulis sp. YBE204]ESQ79116.1 hypothetical protein AEYBE204_10705 [Asticcacaulis sp. YBE204]